MDANKADQEGRRRGGGPLLSLSGLAFAGTFEGSDDPANDDTTAIVSHQTDDDQGEDGDDQVEDADDEGEDGDEQGENADDRGEDENANDDQGEDESADDDQGDGGDSQD
jgi:hypothetical protein